LLFSGTTNFADGIEPFCAFGTPLFPKLDGSAMRDAQHVFDEYLAAAARTGDRRAIAALFGRWNKRLIAHAWRLTGDPETAREAAQDGWIEILRGIGALQDARAFPAWAYRIVTRRCARRIKAAQLRRALNAEASVAPQDEPPEPGADVDAARLRAAVAELPPDQRAAVALFYFEDMSVAQIAVALDVPAGTVKTRLMHARRKLRAALEGAVSCETSTP
jgi:RNA polymerase sigma-70 factor (ECF subfamily)